MFAIFYHDGARVGSDANQDTMQMKRTEMGIVAAEGGATSPHQIVAARCFRRV